MLDPPSERQVRVRAAEEPSTSPIFRPRARRGAAEMVTTPVVDGGAQSHGHLLGDLGIQPGGFTGHLASYSPKPRQDRRLGLSPTDRIDDVGGYYGGKGLEPGFHPAEERAIGDSMAQLIVRNLEDDIRDKLRAMADAHGRSMEEEVREILREAALRAPLDAGVGLGTRLAERFRGGGVDAEIEELRGQPARPADLEP